MDSASTFSFLLLSQSPYLALILTFLCCVFTFFFIRSSLFQKSTSIASGGGNSLNRACRCACSCERADLMAATATVSYVNGGAGGEVVEMVPVVERQTGASMMEQLVPEITTHALSYLDYPSLCRLSMTNSSMRKAANDDNAWKALYHKAGSRVSNCKTSGAIGIREGIKHSCESELLAFVPVADFTMEQDTVTPVNGWKAYYASTRAIVNINAGFFNIIRDRSLPAMGHLWLNADYVKCVHASGEFFTGYNGVMQSWQLAFTWQQGVEFQIRDVRARVLTDMAWVTMKAYVDMENDPFNVTNIFEFHNGQWYMVHHHCSVMMVHGGVQQQMMMLG
ncbi:hypothetical protein LguiA_015796 [Lonicera macranthoides]